MIKHYFVKLTPLNSFFFGTFKEFGKKNENYYLKSYSYPQQTAVLGMLRKKLLEDNNLLLPHELRTPEHRRKEEVVIGVLKNNLRESSFGKIEKLSTLQVYKDGKPLLLSYKVNSFSQNEIISNKGKKRMCNYDPKRFGTIFKDIEESDIFQNSVEIGINVSKRKKNNIAEKAFFKKERIVLKDKSCYFGFEVALEGDLLLKDGFVQLGDKFSIFHMQVEEKEPSNPDLKGFGIEENAIYLLSDLYLEQEDLESVVSLSKGALVLNNKFKFITRDDKNRVGRTVTQNLLTRGSIILLDSDNKILEILENEKYDNYKKVGLNNYIKTI